MRGGTLLGVCNGGSLESSGLSIRRYWVCLRSSIGNTVELMNWRMIAARRTHIGNNSIEPMIARLIASRHPHVRSVRPVYVLRCQFDPVSLAHWSPALNGAISRAENIVAALACGVLSVYERESEKYNEGGYC